jgi:hypothetical protein
MVDKVVLGQVFFEYFGFSCHFLFHRMLHTQLPPGAGTIGQLVADVSSGLSLIPLQETKKKMQFDNNQENQNFAAPQASTADHPVFLLVLEARADEA